MLNRLLNQAIDSHRAAELLEHGGLVRQAKRYYLLSLSHVRCALEEEQSTHDVGNRLATLSLQAVPGAQEAIESISEDSTDFSFRKRERKKVRCFFSLLERTLAERGQKRSATKKRSFWCSELFLTVVVVAGLYGLVSFVEAQYKRYSEPIAILPQPHIADYQELAISDGGRAIFFSNLGKDGKLIENDDFPEGVAVNFQHFRPGNSWSRDVSWHLTAAPRAEVKVSFPTKQISHVALFMTDGNTIWRASQLRTGEKTIIADSLHNGRWIVLEVTAREKAQGRKDIFIERLTGDSISLSAIALFESS